MDVVVDEEEGVVKRTSAEREAGKSLRRTRVRARWWGGVFVLGGARVTDQASPFRKRVFVVARVGADDELVVSPFMTDDMREDDMFWPRARSSAFLFSNHCVSHSPSKKS